MSFFESPLWSCIGMIFFSFTRRFFFAAFGKIFESLSTNQNRTKRNIYDLNTTYSSKNTIFSFIFCFFICFHQILFISTKSLSDNELMTSFCRFFDWTVSKTFCNIIFEAMMKRAQKFTFETKFFSSSNNTITVWTWFISFRNSIYSSYESKWFDSLTPFSNSAIFNWWSWSTIWSLRCNFHRCRLSNNNLRSF